MRITTQIDRLSHSSETPALYKTVSSLLNYDLDPTNRLGLHLNQ